jgi:hypothetical protein
MCNEPVLLSCKEYSKEEYSEEVVIRAGEELFNLFGG